MLLSMTALTTAPLAFPPITRSITDTFPESSGFRRRLAAFLGTLAGWLPAQ